MPENFQSFDKVNIKEGDILPLIYTYYNENYYSVGGIKDIENGISINVKNGDNYIVFKSGGNTAKKLIKEKIVYEDTYIDVECKNKDCFKHQFIFNGKSNNTLKFTYREFVDDMARPAFFQDLQYDLNESNIIGFKGLRVEVIKASNTNIEYKILSPFMED